MKEELREALATRLEQQLMTIHRQVIQLPGIQPMENRVCFTQQLIDSIRRIQYVEAIRQRPQDSQRSNQNAPIFDPLRGAILESSQGNHDEACWLTFLGIHTGKNLRTEWRLAAELYGRNARVGKRTWKAVADDPEDYVLWLDRERHRFTGKFGNHRKYETLRPTARGTGAAIRTYVEWVTREGGHEALFQAAAQRTDGTRRAVFGQLYREMTGSVVAFGRTGAFDYLTMLGKLRLANIEADSTYMAAATGPQRGAKLLFTGQIDAPVSARSLEQQVAQLERHLGVNGDIGMQVIEDALCNWQKSPGRHIYFRG